MSRKESSSDFPGLDESGTFTISIYGGESGQLIREYAMQDEADNVLSVEDAERAACTKLESANFGDVVVVITEESVAAFNQVQILVSA